MTATAVERPTEIVDADALAAKAAGMQSDLAAAIAALPDERDEPTPRKRDEISARRRTLENAATDINTRSQMQRQVVRWSEPWLTALAQMEAILPLITDERTRGFVTGALDVRQLVDGGFVRIVSAAVPVDLDPAFAAPLPALEAQASLARADLARASGALQVSIDHARNVLRG